MEVIQQAHSLAGKITHAHTQMECKADSDWYGNIETRKGCLGEPCSVSPGDSARCELQLRHVWTSRNGKESISEQTGEAKAE